MQRIRSKGTKPEEIVRKFLFSQGFRYRKNDKRFPGNPDIVMPKYKTVIFVHGCFWHMHEGCSCFVMPKSNIEYWKPKLERNKARDIENCKILSDSGWNVITIWECELKKSRRSETLNNLAEYLHRIHLNNSCDKICIKGGRNIMKFKMIHENYNIQDINKSLDFYAKALDLHEKRRKTAPDGSYIIAYIGNDESDFELELTWLADHPEKYNLGDEEFHLAFRVDDFNAAHELHKKMGCICFENPSMGIYFIQDPDGYWLEIIPTR